MRSAVIINMFSKYSVVLIQLILNFILARLISPQEFGVVAIITVFTSFFAILSDMGIGTAVIQYKNLDRDDYNNIFSFTVYLGLALSALFWLVALLVSVIYKNRVYSSLGLILMVSVFFNTLNMVPNALMLKEQRFLEVGIRTFTVIVVCGGITVILAFLRFSYYAVVINSVLQSAGIFIWNYFRNPLRFKFRFKWDSLRLIRGFSGYQFLFSMINYFARNTDTLMVGQTMGESAVGLYDKAYRLMTYPMTMFSGIVTPVIHPVLSNYQDDHKVIYGYLVKIFRILMYSSVFISCVCYYAPEEIIHILYGDNWDLAIKPFRILSISVVAQMCNSVTGAFFQSIGKTKLLFKAGILSTLIIVACTFIGVFSGSIESVAMAVSAGYLLVFWSAYYILIKKGFHMNFLSFLKIVIKPFLIYGLLLVVLPFILVDIDNVFGAFAFKVLIVLVLYFVLLVITKELSNVRDVFTLLFRRKEK